MNTPDATGQIEIDASAEMVFAFLSDPANMGQIAEENRKVFRRASRVGKVGTRFVGVNRNGWHVWPTFCRVSDVDPGNRYAFEVQLAPGVRVARWQYDLEPTEQGCRVIESTWDRRPAWLGTVSTPVTGVADRAEANSRNIAKTLIRLKDRIESGS